MADTTPHPRGESGGDRLRSLPPRCKSEILITERSGRDAVHRCIQYVHARGTRHFDPRYQWYDDGRYYTAT